MFFYNNNVSQTEKWVIRSINTWKVRLVCRLIRETTLIWISYQKVMTKGFLLVCWFKLLILYIVGEISSAFFNGFGNENMSTRQQQQITYVLLKYVWCERISCLLIYVYRIMDLDLSWYSWYKCKIINFVGFRVEEICLIICQKILSRK